MSENPPEWKNPEWTSEANETFARLMTPELQALIQDWVNDELINRHTQPSFIFTALCGALSEIIGSIAFT